jgi:hypothetical protein
MYNRAEAQYSNRKRRQSLSSATTNNMFEAVAIIHTLLYDLLLVGVPPDTAAAAGPVRDLQEGVCPTAPQWRGK